MLNMIIKRLVLGMILVAASVADVQARDYTLNKHGGSLLAAWDIGSYWDGYGQYGINGLPDLGDNVYIFSADGPYGGDGIVLIGGLNDEDGSPDNSYDGSEAFKLVVDSVSTQYDAELIQMSTTLTTINEYIGFVGRASFYQRNGTHTNGGLLSLGYLPGSTGTYTMDDGRLNVTQLPEELARWLGPPAGNGELVIGYFGNGIFNQNDPTITIYQPRTNPIVTADYLILGKYNGSTGTYNFENGELITLFETIGDAGTGTFKHDSDFRYTPARHTATNLTLGAQAGGVGTYNLFDGELTSLSETIGDAGKGTFNQGGGDSRNTTTHQNTILTLGAQTGGIGTYNLSKGTLASLIETIGAAGEGTFNQSGGSNTTNTLILGAQADGSGTYNLNSGGLTSSIETIGDAGVGTFKQNGGTHTATFLKLGAQASGVGTYTLSGGTLNVNTILDGAGDGTFNLDGGTLNLTGSSMALDTLNIGNAINSTAGFTLESGKTLTASTLTMGANQGSSGTFTLNGGQVDVGTILNGAGNSTFNLDGGALNLAGSSMALDRFNIGNAVDSTAGFTLENGKTLTASTLTMGANQGSRGTFTLNGGQLNVGTILNGAGDGIFNLDGGTLNLTGSSMALDTFNIGNAVNSTVGFTLESGKTLTASTLTMGANQGSRGTFTLNGGQLNVGTILDGEGDGIFNLDGGTLNLTGSSMALDILNIGTNGSLALTSGKMVTVNTGLNNAGILNNSGAVSFDGTYIQSGGQTINNGHLGLTSAQINGGSLSGAGSFTGNVNIGSEGSILPGNVSGTLSIDGDFTTAGEFSVAVLAMDNYGKLDVSGTAILGGSLDMNVIGNPDLIKGKRLSSVIHAGTISGTFASINDNSVLVDFIPFYRFNDVDLFLSAESEGESVGIISAITGKKTGPATVLDTQLTAFLDGGTGSESMDAVITDLLANSSETNQQVSDAVSQTLPLLNGGATKSIAKTARAVNTVIQSRQNSQRGLPSGDEFFGDRHIWFKPFASRANQDDQGDISGYNANTYGMVLGADADIADTEHLGVSFSYARSTVKGNSNVARQSADVDSYQLSIYGDHDLSDSTYINFQADVGLHNNNGSRNIAFMNQVAKSDYTSLSAHLGAGLAHALQWTDRSVFTPSIRADYTVIRDESYMETGSDANLNVDSNVTESFILTVGGRSDYTLTDKVVFTANLGIGYDVINDDSSTTSSFAGAPGVSFVTKGIDTNPWITYGGVGVIGNITDAIKISAHYDVEIREGFDNQTVSAKISWMF